MQQVPEFLKPPFTVEANKVPQADVQKATANQPTQQPEESAPPFFPKEKTINVAAPYQVEGFKTYGSNQVIASGPQILKNLATKSYVEPAVVFASTTAGSILSIPQFLFNPVESTKSSIEMVKQIPQKFQENPATAYAEVAGLYVGGKLVGKIPTKLHTARVLEPEIIIKPSESFRLVYGDTGFIEKGTIKGDIIQTTIKEPNALGRIVNKVQQTILPESIPVVKTVISRSSEPVILEIVSKAVKSPEMINGKAVYLSSSKIRGTAAGKSVIGNVVAENKFSRKALTTESRGRGVLNIVEKTNDAGKIKKVSTITSNIEQSGKAVDKSIGMDKLDWAGRKVAPKYSNAVKNPYFFFAKDIKTGKSLLLTSAEKKINLKPLGKETTIHFAGELDSIVRKAKSLQPRATFGEIGKSLGPSKRIGYGGKSMIIESERVKGAKVQIGNKQVAPKQRAEYITTSKGRTLKPGQVPTSKGNIEVRAGKSISIKPILSRPHGDFSWMKRTTSKPSPRPQQQVQVSKQTALQSKKVLGQSSVLPFVKTALKEGLKETETTLERPQPVLASIPKREVVSISRLESSNKVQSVNKIRVVEEPKAKVISEMKAIPTMKEISIVKQAQIQKQFSAQKLKSVEKNKAIGDTGGIAIPPVIPPVIPFGFVSENDKKKRRKLGFGFSLPVVQHRANDVFPVPDLLSATITEAKHPGIKALAPYPTKKVKHEFTRYLGGFNAFFKTAQQRRK